MRYRPIMNPLEHQLAADIYSAAHVTGRFRLRSGLTATEYFDKYQFESEPALLHRISEALLPRVPPGIDLLAGLELGGIPLATMLAQLTGKPALFVRKKAKEYGTLRLAEGGEVGGRRLLVVEDVITTGGQILESTRQLREMGAEARHALVVIDRLQGGRESLAKAGIDLHTLFTIEDLESAASKGG